MKYSALLTVLSLAMLPGDAAAQDLNLPPTFGAVSLRAGFSPDPFTIDLQSGGSILANSLRDNGSMNANRDSSCTGYIAHAPDFRVHYSWGSRFIPLRIGVASGADTTLVINGPDGRWYCDDDSGNGLNPLIEFNDPTSGSYDIWVGTFGSASLADARLFISETRNANASAVGYGARSTPRSAMGPDWRLEPTYETYNARSGSASGPYQFNLQAGGPYRVGDTVSDRGPRNSGRDRRCTGYVANAPDVRLNFTPGSLPLIISVSSNADTTLIINEPDGNWYCDDDSGPGTNPLIRLDSPSSGQYDIWVGTYATGSLRDATLLISNVYMETTRVAAERTQREAEAERLASEVARRNEEQRARATAGELARRDAAELTRRNEEERAERARAIAEAERLAAAEALRQRRERLLARFPEESMVEAILARQIEIGWPDSAVIESFGRPQNVTTAGAGEELWQYSNGFSIILIDGVVHSFQSSR